MPEGDTIHQLAGAMRPHLVGRAVTGGRLREAPERRLDGRSVSDVAALGKHLLIDFDDGQRLRSHLGLHGSWHRYAPGERWKKPPRQASIVLETAEDVFVCFNAKEVRLGPRDAFAERVLAHRLGPDLSRADADLDEALRRARARRESEPFAPVSDLLLDQHVASGIGNVYKSEILFLARVHPETPVGALDDALLRSLLESAQTLLRSNLRGGTRTTRGRLRGRRDRETGPKWVYGRAELPCLECSAPIAFVRVGKGRRSTYWCPACQAAPAAHSSSGGTSPK